MPLHSIVKGITSLNNTVSKYSMLLIFPLIAVMLYDVAVRYLLNSPVLWGSELSTMIFGLYMLFAGPASVLDKVQVGVDIFSSRWQPRTRAVVNCLTYGFTAVLFYNLIVTSAMYAIESWDIAEVSSSAWGQPVYHWKTCIPVAFSLIFLQTIAEFLSNLHFAWTGKEMPE